MTMLHSTQSRSTLLSKQRGIVRRSGSTSDKIRHQIALLTPLITVRLKDENGEPIPISNPISYESPVMSLLELLGNDVEMYLPDYDRLLSKDNYQEPLWAMGFYNGITAIVIRKEPRSTNRNMLAIGSSIEVMSTLAEENTLRRLSTEETTAVKRVKTSNSKEPDKEQIIESSIEEGGDVNSIGSVEPLKPSRPLQTSPQLSNQSTRSPVPKLSQTTSIKRSPKYHFIVKGPYIQTYVFEEDEQFDRVFAGYENSSQGKKPKLKFGSVVVGRNDTPKSIKAIHNRQNILEVSMVDLAHDSEVEKVKFGVRDASGTYAPVYFNAKVNAKVKRFLKKYANTISQPLRSLEFFYNGEKLNSNPKFTVIGDLGIKNTVEPYIDMKLINLE